MKGMEVNTRTVVIVKSEPPLKKLKSALKDPNRISSQSKKAKKVTFMGIPDPTPNNSMVESSDSVARSESFSSKEDISSSKSSEADKKTYQHYIEKKKKHEKRKKESSDSESNLGFETQESAKVRRKDTPYYSIFSENEPKKSEKQERRENDYYLEIKQKSKTKEQKPVKMESLESEDYVPHVNSHPKKSKRNNKTRPPSIEVHSNARVTHTSNDHLTLNDKDDGSASDTDSLPGVILDPTPVRTHRKKRSNTLDLVTPPFHLIAGNEEDSDFSDTSRPRRGMFSPKNKWRNSLEIKKIRKMDG